MTADAMWVTQAGLFAVAGGAVCVFAIQVIRISRGRSHRVWPLFAIVGVLVVVAVLLWATVANRATTESTVGPAAPTEIGEVVAVIDGDTFDVQLPDGRARVRIIGIDTPEIAHREGEVDECYARPALAALDSLLYRRTVTLQADPTQADTDKYGRLLRHVDYDGVNVALAALKAGLGEEYTFATPYVGQADYVAAMEDARASGAGLWGECAPGGR